MASAPEEGSARDFPAPVKTKEGEGSAASYMNSLSIIGTEELAFAASAPAAVPSPTSTAMRLPVPHARVTFAETVPARHCAHEEDPATAEPPDAQGVQPAALVVPGDVTLPK